MPGGALPPRAEMRPPLLSRRQQARRIHNSLPERPSEAEFPCWCFTSRTPPRLRARSRGPLPAVPSHPLRCQDDLAGSMAHPAALRRQPRNGAMAPSPEVQLGWRGRGVGARPSRGFGPGFHGGGEAGNLGPLDTVYVAQPLLLMGNGDGERKRSRAGSGRCAASDGGGRPSAADHPAGHPRRRRPELAQGRSRAARRCWRTSTSARRSSTSTTSASPSGSSTPAASARTATSRTTQSLADVTRADLFQRAGEKTPVFVRFSTVAGSKGSADLARDVRGFAVKFYTKQGNWDLVGNNIPVFFIQDAIKFPDLIHAAKPEPDRGFPQAQTAHDNFWDFISLTPESMHMIMWIMSDRTIPRSFRFMEGFGVHTFRLVNAEGQVDLRQVPLEAEAGPAIGGLERGGQDQRRRSRLPPPRPLGRHRGRRLPGMGAGRAALRRGVRREVRLRRARRDQDHPRGAGAGAAASAGWSSTACVDNFFAETEQVAFCTQNIVPGIDFSNDPLLQGRNFSYLDTQLKRLGGPNFTHIPINAPKCPFAHFQQDGHMAMHNPKGRANYEPNSWGDAGGPRESPERGFTSFPEQVEGPEVRARSETFADHYSQARQFYISQTDDRAAAHRQCADLRAEQGRDARRSGRGWSPTCSTSTEPGRQGGQGPAAEEMPAGRRRRASRHRSEAIGRAEHLKNGPRASPAARSASWSPTASTPSCCSG